MSSHDYHLVADFSSSAEDFREYFIDKFKYKVNSEFKKYLMGEGHSLIIENCPEWEKSFCQRQFEIDVKIRFIFQFEKFFPKTDLKVIGDFLIFLMNEFEGDFVYLVWGEAAGLLRKNNNIYVDNKNGKGWIELFEEYQIPYENVTISSTELL